MKKVLIHFEERKLKPVGGPAGYLWNLRQGISELEKADVDIHFLKDKTSSIEENQFLRKKIPERIKDLRRVYKYIRLLKRSQEIDMDKMNYDIIHYHNTIDMYLDRNFLEKYKGTVVLTSHTPCVPFQERMERINPIDYKRFKNQLDKVIAIDEYAFNRADKIIFPCKEAEEPYYNTWENYSDIRKSGKYDYIPTGIVGCKAQIDRKEFREKYNIPEDSFVISYAGRHNEIKGYCDLLKIGEEVLKEKNIYFLVAGVEEPLKGLPHENWIEIGWTDDPHSLIAASDVFILPNRETYFDLILLEVMSLGVPVILSNTGGNKYFKKYNSSGFMYFESVSEAVKRIHDMNNYLSTDRIAMGQSLKKIFDDDFTIKTFAHNYLEIMKKI